MAVLNKIQVNLIKTKVSFLAFLAPGRRKTLGELAGRA
jgi:hypothetical protein